MEKNFNNNQPELSVQEQTRVRIEKLDKLKEKGVAPFGQKFDVKDKICDIKANYENKSKEELKIVKRISWKAKRKDKEMEGIPWLPSC